MPLDAALVHTLTTLAEEAAAHAYAPYSRFAVGAALFFDDGAMVSGCNVENASYGLSSCAERNALFRAISQGGSARLILGVAVFHQGQEACAPCGACRQVLSEFAANGCEVFYSHGSQYERALFDHLLPLRFCRGTLRS